MSIELIFVTIICGFISKLSLLAVDFCVEYRESSLKVTYQKHWKDYLPFLKVWNYNPWEIRLLELIGLCALLAVYYHTGLGLSFFLYATIIMTMWIISLTDLIEYSICDLYVAIGTILTIAIQATQGKIITALIGAVTGFAIMFSLWLVCKILPFLLSKFLKNYDSNVEYMGFGDVTLSIFLGSFLGPFSFITVFVFSFYLYLTLNLSIKLFSLFKPLDIQYIPAAPVMSVAVFLHLYCGFTISSLFDFLQLQ